MLQDFLVLQVAMENGAPLDHQGLLVYLECLENLVDQEIVPISTTKAKKVSKIYTD